MGRDILFYELLPGGDIFWRCCGQCGKSLDFLRSWDLAFCEHDFFY
jgi:hypothetical protein